MPHKTYFGLQSVKKLKNVLLEERPKNVFLVTGKKSFTLSGAKNIMDNILKEYNVTHFNNFEENPRITDVKKGVSHYKRNNVDLVIAVGGGSAIDIAKLVNIFANQKEKPEEFIRKQRKIKNKGKYLVAIPTTSGTGSEATHFAVVYINKTKYSVAHEFVLPNTAIIDPQFTLNLPSHITASTGMDALSQAMESYWCINSTTESKKYAKEAIRLINKNLSKVVNNPDTDSRVKMSKAAYLSGKAINITKTTAPHAVSYPITSHFGVSHGHAVALTLASFLEYNFKVNEKDVTDKRGVEYVKNTILELNEILECKSVLQLKKRINTLMKEIRLTTQLSDVGVETTADIDKIVSNINIERLDNNPRKITTEKLKKILYQIK